MIFWVATKKGKQNSQKWYSKNLLNPAGSQATGLTALEDNSHKVESISQIKKHRTLAKMKWLGYNSSQTH